MRATGASCMHWHYTHLLSVNKHHMKMNESQLVIIKLSSFFCNVMFDTKYEISVEFKKKFHMDLFSHNSCLFETTKKLQFQYRSINKY